MVQLYCDGMRLYRAEFNIVESYCGKYNRPSLIWLSYIVRE